jgi:sialic acid synthase SpsE
MIDTVRIVEKTIGNITYGGVKGEEAMKKFRRSLFFVKDIKEGAIIDETNIRSIRPGNGIHTKYYWDILGKKVKKDIEYGTPVSWDLIEN